MNKSQPEKNTPKLTSAVKIGIAATLISLFIYNAYILRGSLQILFGYLSNVPGDVVYVRFVGVAFWAGWVSLIARFIALVLALSAVYLLWIRAWPFMRVNKLVSAALILEGVNFLGLVPSLWFLLHPGTFSFPPSLGYGYLVQILFTVPFLWALAYQVGKYKNSNQVQRLLQVAALAFVGYTVALVVNEVSRWASMITIASLTFLEGIRAVGFFNALAFMPFAIAFAIAGAYQFYRRKERSAMKWFGASLIVIGLNYTIYLAFTYIVNSLNTLPLVDIWTIPLLAVGITLILNAYELPKRS
jgi:hypothetical protein